MPLYTPDQSTPLTNTYGSATAGETPTPITPNIAGDSIAMIGRYVTLVFTTTGTIATITMDSVRLSDQGQDTNVTVTMPTTGSRRVVLDASNDRFKQTSGNVGYLNLSYSSVTGLTLTAHYVN
jgi:phosphosulfolactate synthase (CoM biosynthesis protein A)